MLGGSLLVYVLTTIGSSASAAKSNAEAAQEAVTRTNATLKTIETKNAELNKELQGMRERAIVRVPLPSVPKRNANSANPADYASAGKGRYVGLLQALASVGRCPSWALSGPSDSHALARTPSTKPMPEIGPSDAR